jgi:hypothetical protein
MVVIGLSSGASLIFRDRIAAGISSLIFFCGIAIIVEIKQNRTFSGAFYGSVRWSKWAILGQEE